MACFFINLLIWFLLGYAGGWIAAHKGYPPVAGILIGILCGPIGLVVAALLPRTSEGRLQAEIAQEIAAEEPQLKQRNNCPSCGRKISATARVCGFCEHRFV